jgi:PASTA domain
VTNSPDETDLARMVQQYLDELGRALGRLPVFQRDRLVGEIREHIAELRVERPPRDASDMEALLNRVGLPEDIAAVALEDVEYLDENEPVPSVVETVGAMARSRRSRRLKGFVGAAVVLVLVLVAVVSVAATHHNNVPRSDGAPSTSAPAIGPDGSSLSRLTVPNVIGTSVAQAQVELQSAGFSVKVVSDPSGAVPGGSVFSQGPVAGAFMPGGSTVTVYVSTGPGS